MEEDIMNQSIQPMGIKPLITEERPDFKGMALNVAKNKALDYAAGKVGLNMAQASGLASILGIGSSIFAPLGLVSALTGRSLGISDYLANRRAQKEARRLRLNDPQGNVTTYPVGIMAMQPTAQEAYKAGQYNTGNGGMTSNQSTGTSAERGAALHG
jgi:hypothetical protein|tara:strand:+ start:532 stop:1002 length:471 start_codon:yes stop_codon:yes gene_type:complete